MYNELRVIALTDKGKEAINLMVADDNKETKYNRNKVEKQWELKIISQDPLIYSGLLKPEAISDITNHSRRIGHIAKIDNGILIDTFMNSVKSNTIARMRTNGASLKTDYKIELVEVDTDG
jgi:hypothetical protein